VCFDCFVGVQLLICFCTCCVCLVLIIDDAQKDVDEKIIMEFTFVQPVMSVRLRMDRYIGTHKHMLYVSDRYCWSVQVWLSLPLPASTVTTVSAGASDSDNAVLTTSVTTVQYQCVSNSDSYSTGTTESTRACESTDVIADAFVTTIASTDVLRACCTQCKCLLEHHSRSTFLLFTCCIQDMAKI